jgi:hypothetical protein
VLLATWIIPMSSFAQPMLISVKLFIYKNSRKTK